MCGDPLCLLIQFRYHALCGREHGKKRRSHTSLYLHPNACSCRSRCGGCAGTGADCFFSMTMCRAVLASFLPVVPFFFLSFSFDAVRRSVVVGAVAAPLFPSVCQCFRVHPGAPFLPGSRRPNVSRFIAAPSSPPQFSAVPLFPPLPLSACPLAPTLPADVSLRVMASVSSLVQR